jgi:hypothetical protein
LSDDCGLRAEDLLVAVLAQPRRARSLSIPEWDAVLRVARKEKLLSRLGAILDAVPEVMAGVPTPVPPMFRAARAYPLLIQSRALWEVGRILAATADLNTEILLLKGVAYVRAGLPLARARAFADVDILVRESELSMIEGRLLAQGWVHQQTDEYDQRYYREWMHEIPPLRHRDREMEVDIHHRILPRTSRLAPRPELLWAASVALAPRLRILAPADMVLHGATHLFYDGEISGDFRDLLDLHELLVHFGAADPRFWDTLIERAALLGLGRPLYYAVRFCGELLETPVPDRVRTALLRDAPAALVDALMARLVRNVLAPRAVGRRGAPVSAWLLYVRSHWLRMTPWLLARHLSRKALRRVSNVSSVRSQER